MVRIRLRSPRVFRTWRSASWPVLNPWARIFNNEAGGGAVEGGRGGGGGKGKGKDRHLIICHCRWLPYNRLLLLFQVVVIIDSRRFVRRARRP